MSTSNDLITYWPYAFSLLIGLLQVFAAIFFFQDRHASTWLALIGSLMGAPIAFINLVIGLITRSYHSEPRRDLDSAMQALSYVSAMGLIMFASGILWIALRRRALASRIAELEQIIEAQNSRLH